MNTDTNLRSICNKKGSTAYFNTELVITGSIYIQSPLATSGPYGMIIQLKFLDHT